MPAKIVKLYPYHTAAGIEVRYDDHVMSLCRNGRFLSRLDAHGKRVYAIWTGRVTLKEVLAEADKYVEVNV